MKTKTKVVALNGNKVGVMPKKNRTQGINTIPIPKLLKKVQDKCNEFIRKRDNGKPCISCGKYTILEAGHYWAAGHYTALRFSEYNIHGQCHQCNFHKHGNQLEYRKGLLRRYGADYVDKLDLSADLRKLHKWDRIELIVLFEYYKRKIKEL